MGAVSGATTVSDRVAKSISQEAGVDFVALHSGSLGAEGSGVDTYLGMFRKNVKAIADAPNQKLTKRTRSYVRARLSAYPGAEQPASVEGWGDVRV